MLFQRCVSVVIAAISLGCLPAITITVLANSESSTVVASNPSIEAGVPFFYYENLKEAADWYENKLGLKKFKEEDWVVIFELTPSSFLGLVNATGGSLKPIEEKGAMLSVETNELEAWYKKVKGVEGINLIQEIEVGADGMIEEFRLMDPGGYIVEFFRWREDGNGTKSSSD